MYLDLNIFNSLSISTTLLHTTHKKGVWPHSHMTKQHTHTHSLLLLIDAFVVFFLVELLQLHFIVETLHTALVLLQNVL